MTRWCSTSDAAPRALRNTALRRVRLDLADKGRTLYFFNSGVQQSPANAFLTLRRVEHSDGRRPPAPHP